MTSYFVKFWGGGGGSQCAPPLYETLHICSDVFVFAEMYDYQITYCYCSNICFELSVVVANIP